jgi:hypothetical protein
MNRNFVSGCFCAFSLAAVTVTIQAALPFRSIRVGATPESVVLGFGGNLYVTLPR